jgi:cytochrome c peroxidase
VILTAATALSACVDCPPVPGLSASQCAEVKAMRLPSALPASPNNAVADDLAAAQLGHQVFFDARFSSNQQVRCGTCHEPELYFTDGDPTSTGLVTVTRNSPSLYASPYLHWQMWDGRADSLWSQPLLAFENPKEMDFTRLEIAHRLEQSYRAPYEALFGPLPMLSDAQRFPARAKPGDAAWAAMSSDDRAAIDLVVANLGRALEAYERKLAMRPGRFDAFLDGDATRLDATEREGLRVFVAAGCTECHRGPLLTDEAFHALQVPGNDERGRAEGLEILARSEFKGADVPAPTAADEFAWKTPSLRNVARTGPYGHNGHFATLEEVVDFHLPSSVKPAERTALLAFLQALTAGDPPSPWNNWPNR